MKIIAIGRNYAKHAAEFNNEVPASPVFFLKPESALLKDNKPFYYPEFTSDLHYELEVVLRFERLGKHIESEFAHRYFSQIGLGIDFTARDIQRDCKKKGLPWEAAKAFDGSAAISSFVAKDTFEDLNQLHFRLEKNGEVVQEGNTADLIFPFETLIEHVSKFMTIKIGDLLFTGTPEGVGPVKIGDRLTAYLEGEKMLDFEIK
ncbi:MAG: fumarylacetoacetate hydrolase family protein [Bacteroidales bacterium]|jgi:2-keto-4-pentenoate hydratase/2-oxohepta-3-ene-1,7-dioic acid hydratase in catechol pathway